MKGQRFLIVYSGVLTAVFAVTVLSGFVRSPLTRFGEIDVQRINVREPDGTLRMVISDSAHLPGVIIRGKAQAKVDRPQAGMLFYNDEGSENGGLIFGGRRDAKGNVVDSGGSLSFDRYDANQVVQLLGVDDRDNQMAGLAVSSSEPGGADLRRVWVGRTADGEATLALMDARGRRRIVLAVGADGDSRIEFLDASGRVVRTVGAEVAATPSGNG